MSGFFSEYQKTPVSVIGSSAENHAWEISTSSAVMKLAWEILIYLDDHAWEILIYLYDLVWEILIYLDHFVWDDKKVIWRGNDILSRTLPVLYPGRDNGLILGLHWVSGTEK